MTGQPVTPLSVPPRFWRAQDLRAALVLLASIFQLGPTESSSWSSHGERTARVHIMESASRSHRGWEAGCFRWDTSAPWSSRHGTRVRGLPDQRGNPRCAQTTHTHVDLTMDVGEDAVLHGAMVPPRGRLSPAVSRQAGGRPSRTACPAECGTRLASRRCLALCSAWLGSILKSPSPVCPHFSGETSEVEK